MKRFILTLLASLLYINYRLAFFPLVNRKILTFAEWQKQTADDGANQIAWTLIFDIAVILWHLFGFIWTVILLIGIVLIAFLVGYAIKKFKK